MGMSAPAPKSSLSNQGSAAPQSSGQMTPQEGMSIFHGGFGGLDPRIGSFFMKNGQGGAQTPQTPTSLTHPPMTSQQGMPRFNGGVASPQAGQQNSIPSQMTPQQAMSMFGGGGFGGGMNPMIAQLLQGRGMV